MTRTSVLGVAGVIVVTPLFLGACTVSTQRLMIDKDLLAAEVQTQLTQKLNSQAPAISCPDDLEPKVGATTTCLMSAPSGTYNLTVTVTKLDPGAAGNYQTGNAIFDAKLADKPNP